MGVLLLRIRAWWDSADKSQKMVTIVGGSFLVLLLLGTFLIASRPKMGLLYGNLDDAAQGSVITDLQNMGIPVEFDGKGNVMVPTDRIPELRAKLAAQGKTPRGATFSADTTLASMNIMQTSGVERERLKALLETNIAQTIESLDGVQSAHVSISLENDSPFESEKKPAKASVTLIEKAGAMFSPDKGRAVASMVANSVQGLDLNNIVILNQFGETLYDPAASTGAQGIAATKLQTEHSEAARRRTELQSDLDRAFGPGATIAQVDCEIDFDEKESQTTTNNPSEKPVASQQMTEEMKDGAAPPANGGIAGAAGQMQPAAGAPGDANSSYKNTQTVKTFLESVTNEQVKHAAGSLKSMSVNVLADKAKNIDENALRQVINGFMGAKAADPNFKATVTTVPFDQSAKKLLSDAAAQQGSQEKLQQLISLLPIGALLLIAVMVMRAIGKYAKNQTVIVATPDGALMPLSMSSLPAGSAAAAATSAAPGSQMNAAQKALKSSIPAEEDDDAPEIKAIKDKLNVPLEQIKKMSNERPEVVAMLIKSWLLEEGIRR